ncbi:MAG: long-chain fatty acid--CoA ligase [Austwickia sp.]|nr:long-chain fatty acid--CoA ligase [Austwickia sp.]
MREKSVPVVTTATEAHLGLLTARNARLRPDRVAFSRRAPGSLVWEDVTARQFHGEVRALGAAMRAAGLAFGDRVAIMSRTRYEWTLTDFALWTAGLVGVPVYETSSADQVRWILADSGARAIVVESADHAATVASVRAECPQLEHVWQIDAGDLDRLAAGPQDQAALDEAGDRTATTDLATIIYTSGTTGLPKGCELTHGNFLELSANAIDTLPEITRRPDASTLLFLPLAHVLARFIQVLTVDAGFRVGHAPDIKTLLPDVGSFQPTLLLAVPRVFEKIYNSLDAKATTEGKGRIFTMAAATSISYSRALDGRMSPLLRARHKLFDVLVYSKLRAALGGQCAFAISGGAPLGERLGHFYRGAGVTILEGYGLTETTAPTNVNTPSFTTIGTVGQPLPGTSTRLADDGELLIKGVGVFRGYFNNPTATAEAFTADGWFHTGDLGAIDDAGRLTITGRKKEILVTAGGKNVAPAPLEDIIRAHPLVSQCMVIGDRKPFIAALITLDPEMVPLWGQAHGLADLTLESARTDETVRQHLQMAVDRANARVSRAEAIRKFAILDGDFTEESGHLTPSLKVKRALVMKDYAQAIHELYAESRGPARPTDAPTD